MLKYKALIKSLIGLSLVVVAIICANNFLDFSLLYSTINDINGLHLTLASIVTIAVTGLSTSRFALLNKKFGGDEDWLFLHRVNMLSTLYSQIALPLIAQIMGRVVHGSLLLSNLPNSQSDSGSSRP
jgi:uncharacterized membrane protein YbhN (UPF0104 family)